MPERPAIAIVQDKHGNERTIVIRDGSKVADKPSESKPPAVRTNGGHKGESTKIVTRE